MSGRAGQIKRAPMDPSQGRSRMWQSMRVLRSFTIADVITSAEVGASAAMKYVGYLRKAGYVRCVVPRERGRTGAHAQFRLVTDTGPHAPRIGAHGVCDPNLEPAGKPATVTIPKAEYERALRCIDVVTHLRVYAPTEAIRDAAAKALEVAR